MTPLGTDLHMQHPRELPNSWPTSRRFAPVPTVESQIIIFSYSERLQNLHYVLGLRCCLPVASIFRSRGRRRRLGATSRGPLHTSCLSSKTLGEARNRLCIAALKVKPHLVCQGEFRSCWGKSSTLLRQQNSPSHVAMRFRSNVRILYSSTTPQISRCPEWHLARS